MHYTICKNLLSLLILLVVVVVLSPYISSWFPMVVGYPLGPIIRLITLFFILALLTYFVLGHLKVPMNGISFFFFLYLLGLILFLPFSSGKFTQVLIGLHSVFIYPLFFVLLFSYVQFRLPSNIRYCFVQKSISFLSILFPLLAMIALIDVLTQGEFTLFLGYNPNYGGESFKLITRYYDYVRANGGFSDALAFGYLMALGIIFFLYKLKNYESKFTTLFALFLLTIALFATLTRGAILVLFIITTLYAVKSKKIIFVYIIVVVLIVLLLLAGFGEVYVGRFTDSTEGSAQSTNLRIVMAMNSIEYLYQNPLGVGLGTQGAGNLLTHEDQRVNTDNFIFHVLLELGIPVGVLFLLFIFSIFRQAISNKHSRKFIVYLFVLFLVSALVSSSFQSGVLSILFWYVLVLFMVSNNKYDSKLS